MRANVIRAVSVLMILCMLSACASSTTMRPLGIHSAADMRQLPLRAERLYMVHFGDGTRREVEGGAMIFEDDMLCLYSSEDGRWTRYPRAAIDEIYLVDVDQVKKRNNTALITGAAVLSAFVAAAAGGYLIEKNVK